MKTRFFSVLLTLSAAFLLVFAFAGMASAKTIEVSDKDSFWAAFENANDGDVINVTQDINIGNQNAKIMKDNCLVTINLNGHTLTTDGGGDNFGIGDNSALLLQNGKLSHLDTLGSSNGILILNGVSVTSRAWLGNTTAWIVNKSYITGLRTEGGCINPGASDLNPLGSWQPGATGTMTYQYDNPAPAMVGSGVTWKCLATLQDDFSQAKEAGYNRIIMLKNYDLTANSKLEASGINFNLGGYTLTTGEYSLSFDNSTDANTVCNGTITGDLSMDTNSGAVTLSNLDISGTVSNGNHPTVFSGGHYNTISSGAGEIAIKDGFFAGNDSDYLSANTGYEIFGGYFVNKPDASNIEAKSTVVEITKEEKGITYNYTVEHTHNWTYSVSGATFTATCDCKYCDVSELAIQAPKSCKFDGESKEVTLSATTLGDKTGISASDVKYYVKGETTEMTDKPAEIGEYVATLTIEGAGTATCEFEIYGTVSLTVGETVTWHDTITAACDAAGTDVGTVKIYRDMQESGDVSINSGENITVDLNGYTIRATNNVFIVKSGGELTLTDTSADQTGKLVNADGDTTVRGMDIAGKVTINAGTISTANTWSGGGLFISGGTVIMNGGAIKDCKSGNGGGVYVNSGSFTMNGGTLSGNTATSNGGGIYQNGGTVTLDGAVIKENAATGSAYSFGGGIYQNGGTLSITNCTIDGNTATSGAGLYVRNSGTTATVSGGTFSKNSAPAYGGGAIWVCAGQLTVKDNCQIKNNSGKEGGAIGTQAYQGSPSVELNGCTIEGNTANTASGGAIVHGGGSLTIIGGTITGNSAPNGDAGGIYHNGTSLVVSGTAQVTGNTKGADESVATSNLYLPSGNTITVGEGGLASGASIGATTQALPTVGNPVAITTGSDSVDYSAYFASDDAAYCVFNTGTGASQQVKLGIPVAKIVETEAVFATVQAAVDAVSKTADGTPATTIKMIADSAENVDTGQADMSGNSRKIKLDLNGHVLSAPSAGGSVVTIEAGVLTLQDSAGSGKITGGNGTLRGKGGRAAGGVNVYANSTFNMESGSISGNNVTGVGGGVYNVGIFNLSGGTISGNSAGRDGGGVLNEGTFTMEGGTIGGTEASSANTAVNGGGVCNLGGTFAMTAGTISGNKVVSEDGATYGGGVYNKSSGTDDAAGFTMSGGTVSDNTAVAKDGDATYGGGVYNSGTFEMSDDAKLSGNAAYYGGGVGNYGGTFTMKGGTIENNTAAEIGGGVYNSGTFNMKGGTIKGNSAEEDAEDSHGGGVGNEGEFTMSGGTISGNKTVGFGGGVYNVGDTFTMEDGTISGNTAALGGGVGNEGGFTMSGGTITENKAAGYTEDKITYFYGGGVFNPAVMTVSGTAQITGNTKADGATANNVFLLETTITVDAAGLSTGALIGVTLGTQDGTGAVTGANSADYHEYFVADDETLTSYNDKTSDTNQVVKLKLAHVHVWAYSLAEGKTDTITATCSGTGTCDYAGEDKTLTIQASSATYDGEQHAASFTQTSFLGKTGTNLPAINYQKKKSDGGYEDATSDVPSSAGTYKASFTVGEDSICGIHHFSEAADRLVECSHHRREQGLRRHHICHGKPWHRERHRGW